MSPTRFRSYLLFTVASVTGRFIARIFEPPNGSRRDWEFGDETYVEALATVLNSLAAEGWRLEATDTTGGASTFIMVRDS